MSQMIFTSYFGKLRHIPKNILPISVALYLPTNINHIITYQELAPTAEILKKWKSRSQTGYTEDDYTRDYINDVLNHLDANEIYNRLMKEANGRSVVLLCYEKDGFCHRHIIRQWFIDHGIACQEFKNMDDELITNLNILECSSKGDKRYSAFYARVSVFGKYDSIENHYQSCKRFFDQSIIEPKGLNPDYIEIRNKKFEKQYATAYYKLLWVKYLDEHPELVEHAKQFDYFHDVFRGKYSLNCQADVIKQYVKNGRESIMNEDLIKEFITKLITERNTS
jgi:hypothetical protein